MKDKSSDPWVVLDYEAWMLERSIQERERLGRSIYAEERLQVLNNALTESALLHARTLCELFTNPEGKFPTDIELQLSYLLPDWDWGKPKYELLNGLLSELEDKYGKPLDPKSPRAVFDIMLTSATLARRSEYDYTTALENVLPLIRRILLEIQSKRP
jgi:hypothetical protein